MSLRVQEKQPEAAPPALLANAGTDIHHLSLKAMLCAVVLRVKFQLYASDHIPSPLYLSPFSSFSLLKTSRNKKLREEQLTPGTAKYDQAQRRQA